MMRDPAPLAPALAYPASQFPASFGVQHGRCINHISDLNEGDSYKLSKSATPVAISVWGQTEDGTPLVATTSGQSAHDQMHPSAQLVFMSEFGETRHVTLMRGAVEALLLPDQGFRHDTEYTLIAVNPIQSASVKAATHHPVTLTGTRFAYHA